MAVFYFRARTKEGQLVEGSIPASSQFHGAQELRQQGFYPIEIKEIVSSQARHHFNFSLTKKLQDLAIFAYQAGAMLEAGLPLLTCLDLVKEQLSHEFQMALTEVQQDLREGCSLAAALQKHPTIFPSMMVSMVEAGELGGILDDVFSWLAEHYENELQLLEKIKSAMLYPVLVLLLTMLSLVFMLTLVLPNFSQMLDNMGVQIPLLTQIVFDIGQILVSKGITIGLMGLCLFCFGYFFLQSSIGKAWWDSFVLQLPLIGGLIIKMLSARFARILGALLKSGVPILQAINVAKQTLSNQQMMRYLSLIEIKLQEGKGLGKPLKEIDFFPPQLAEMIIVGEETGQLPDFLFKLNRLYDKEIQRSLERITVLLEPALILLSGLVVGLTVVALMLPIFSLIGSL